MSDLDYCIPLTSIGTTDKYLESCPSLSPATSAEQFFLPKLNRSKFSAVALAATLQEYPSQKLGKKSGNISVASQSTSDFHSCIDNPEELESDLRLQSLYENMVSSVPKTDDAASTPEVREDFNIDPSQHLYDGMKNVWGFSSSFALTKPFTQITEKVAGKILNIATGKEFAGVDEEIKPQLEKLDSQFLNPTITNVVQFVQPLLEKVHSVVHPVVVTVLGPLSLLKHSSIEDKKE